MRNSLNAWESNKKYLKMIAAEKGVALFSVVRYNEEKDRKREDFQERREPFMKKIITIAREFGAGRRRDRKACGEGAGD